MNNNRAGGRNAAGRGHRRDNNNKKVIIGIACAAIAAIAIIIYFTLPKAHSITGTTGDVRSVVDGNTIELTNGLKVKLLGVGNTDASKDFLNQLVGKTVQLTADSKDRIQSYKNPMEETVRAYVRVTAPSVSFSAVNGYILRNVSGAQFENAFCSDSLSAFSSTKKAEEQGGAVSETSSHGVLLSEVELSKKMTPASFLIMVSHADGTKSYGTGFFIYKNGLSLTAAHILDSDDISNVTIFLSDEEGNVTIDKNRNFGRIIAGSSRNDYDFAIFTVQLDNGENVPYLPLAKKCPERGEKVATVGNPEGLTATFTPDGSVAAIREGKIQLNLRGTHGSSGGPICNYYGEVVGIMSEMSNGEGGDNAKFATDITIVRKKLDTLSDIKNYGGK